MSTEVSRNLKEINEEITKLDKNIKDVTKENRSLDKTLRLDPTNTTLLVDKTKNLQTAVDLATQKVQELKKAQVQMKQAVASGDKTEEEYRRLTHEIVKAEVQVKSLNAQLVKTANTKLDSLKTSVQGISRAATIALGSVTALGIGFAEIGDEIDIASKRYRISAEEFQKNRFIFDKATGNGESYSQVLESITQQMAALERGSSRTIQSFEKVGLSLDDIKGKSPADVIGMLVEKLKQLEDVDERAAMASLLLGSRGVELAQVAGLTADEVASLTDEIERAGILTQEEAEQAAGLKDKFDEFTLSTQKVTAELGVSLIPMFEALLKLVKVIIPIIQTLANVFSAIPGPLQTILVILLALLVALPKLISMIIAVNKVLLLFGMNPINLKIMLIVTAVALLIIMLYELAKALGVFGKSYNLDINSTVNTANGPIPFSDYTKGGNVSNSSNTVNNYYDYSTQNNNIQYEADIDEIASQMSTKIKVGGAR